MLDVDVAVLAAPVPRAHPSLFELYDGPYRSVRMARLTADSYEAIGAELGMQLEATAAGYRLRVGDRWLPAAEGDYVVRPCTDRAFTTIARAAYVHENYTRELAGPAATTNLKEN